MELRQLRYFVEAFDRGSLSAAAKSLVVSQPALTRQLQLLERECGVALFERVPTGLLPTRSGTALYQHVVTMLRYADSARDAAREAGPVRETVEIGLAPGLALPWLDNWINAVHLRHPEVYLSLSDSSSNTHLHRIRSGHLDIAFLHEPPPQDLYQQLVLEDDFGVVMAGDPLTTGTDDTFELRELDALDVLVHSREQVPIGHDQLVAAAHQVGANPRWHYANYTENAHACMRATGATAAIMAQVSADRLLPGWTWRRLVNPSLVMHTWLVRQNVVRRAVVDVSTTISDAVQEQAKQ
ncbi:LysR family transcriptional regulator [Rhodococcus sp. 05-340-1]|nr:MULTISPECIES: LysR family transcriptional regulator [unclassified Rhodococcus (in: high G+C Gram-positive bacteria)]OZD86662.1 LysR family transcriptional regulator [Rhodococcus sp. 05-339-2]OZC87753.1 LysR family transcriptional regulator [Rhodococcus sp. 06-412-2C]OZC96404.1 LysR family transcriptional regulator [Rhodococcus sp. 06-412-2B]OZD65388.1 LysR family transcriptional regulator [Rhodococcus sp. 05-340-2]OZD74566.1 LysR family transcriptional regulator [Rhodococcus sp. 05-340-1]